MPQIGAAYCFANPRIILSYHVLFDGVLDEVRRSLSVCRLGFRKALATANIDDANTRQLLTTVISKTHRAHCRVEMLQYNVF
jgi:hypothetical protein